METEDVSKACESVMEGGLMMIEGIEELVSEYDGENVEDVMAETISVMLRNCDDPMRQRRIIALTETIGSRLGSAKLVSLSQALLEKWKNE